MIINYSKNIRELSSLTYLIITKMMLIQLTLLEIEYLFQLMVSQFKSWKKFLESTFVLKKNIFSDKLAI